MFFNLFAIFDDLVEYQLSVYTSSIPKLGLYDFLEKKKYTDIIFLVEGEKFEAHKVILASQCAYFERYTLHIVFRYTTQEPCPLCPVHKHPNYYGLWPQTRSSTLIVSNVGSSSGMFV